MRDSARVPLARRCGRLVRRAPLLSGLVALLVVAGALLGFLGLRSAQATAQAKAQKLQAERAAADEVAAILSYFERAEERRQKLRPLHRLQIQTLWTSERRPYRLLEFDMKSADDVEHRVLDVLVEDAGDRMKVRRSARRIYEEVRAELVGYTKSPHQRIHLRIYASPSDYEEPRRIRFDVVGGTATAALPKYDAAQRDWIDEYGRRQGDE